MSGTILSIEDAIRYVKDLGIVIAFADLHYYFDLINFPEIIQEGEIHLVTDLKKILSDKLYGLTAIKGWRIINVEYLNGIIPEQRSIAFSLSPIDKLKDDTKVFLWSELSFLPIHETPNQYLKTIVLFEEYFNGKK
jgi:hypothetical protein